MKKTKSWIGIICIVLVSAGIIYGISVFLKPETAVLTYSTEHIISTKDTNRLRELLGDSSEWFESDEVVHYSKPYELELDGMKYQIDRYEPMSPIRYGKINGEYTGIMDTDNEAILEEIAQIVNEWDSKPYSYEFCVANYSKETELAALYDRRYDYNDEYILSKEDTSRLRSLLSPEAGWVDESHESSTGDYVLVLDNIKYAIDTDHVYTQMKCGAMDGSPNYACAIRNTDKSIVSEVYSIVEKYIPSEIVQ